MFGFSPRKVKTEVHHNQVNYTKTPDVSWHNNNIFTSFCKEQGQDRGHCLLKLLWSFYRVNTSGSKYNHTF